jgi:hypothetical protein
MDLHHKVIDFDHGIDGIAKNTLSPGLVKILGGKVGKIFWHNEQNGKHA